MIHRSVDGSECKWLVEKIDSSEYSNFIDLLMGNGQKGEGITRKCETYVYYKTDVTDVQRRELLIDFF